MLYLVSCGPFQFPCTHYPAGLYGCLQSILLTLLAVALPSASAKAEHLMRPVSSPSAWNHSFLPTKFPGALTAIPIRRHGFTALRPMFLMFIAIFTQQQLSQILASWQPQQTACLFRYLTTIDTIGKWSKALSPNAVFWPCSSSKSGEISWVCWTPAQINEAKYVSRKCFAGFCCSYLCDSCCLILMAHRKLRMCSHINSSAASNSCPQND